MAFDPVPWAVGGGAVHSSEVARLLAFIATGGREGVLHPTHLAVLPLAVPGQGIRVQPGACVMVNRATNTSNDSYVARIATQEIVTTTPNGPGAPRTDLVCARLENPFISGEPWQIPPDVTAGPYIFNRIIEGVPPGTISLTGLGLGYTGIPLARIDYPVSTGTVTAGMITDLRSVVNPAAITEVPAPAADVNDGAEPSNYRFVNQPHTGGADVISYPTHTTYTNWPRDAVWSLRIPKWCTHIEFDLRINNVQLKDGNATGSTLFTVNGGAVNAMVFDHNYTPSNPIRVTLLNAGTYSVPSWLRGATVTCRLQTRYNPGDSQLVGSVLTADNSSYTAGLMFHHARPVFEFPPGG